MLSPAFDQHFGLLQCIEDFPVQQLIPKLAVEAFVVTVLPRTAGFNVEGFDAKPREPVTHDLGRELGTIVGSDMIRRPMPDEQVADTFQDLFRIQLSIHMDRQAPARELVDHRQHAKSPAVSGPIHDEIVGPNMVRPGRS